MAAVGLASVLYAEMRVSWEKITFSGSVTDAEVAQANRRYRKRLFDREKLCVAVQTVDAATLDFLVERYADVTRFEVRDCPWLRSLDFASPLKNLKVLTIALQPTKKLDVSGVTALSALEELSLTDAAIDDLSPLSSCRELRKLELHSVVLPDLAPLGRLEKVREIDFQGSTVRDFSPLSELPSLEKVAIRSVKVAEDKWATLGALKQVKCFQSGLTSMRTLDWVRNLPQLESLSLFAEEVRDYSALAQAKSLKSFRADSMRSWVDVSFVRGSATLESVALPGCSVRNLAALGDVPSLSSLDLSELKNECSVAFVPKLVNLRSLKLDRSRVQHFDAVKGLPSLRELSLTLLANGSSVNLKGLEACRQLETVTVSRGAFSRFEIDDVIHACQKNVTRFSLVQRN